MKWDFHYLVSPKYARWIIISLITLLTVLIIFEYLTLFYPHSKNSGLESRPQGLIVSDKDNKSYDILHHPLFGDYVATDLNENNVKKSILNVNVVGILLASSPMQSQVIIQSASGEEKTYKVGDLIPGDAVIKKIMAWGILVDREGSIESLSLPKNDLIFEPMAKPLKEE